MNTPTDYGEAVEKSKQRIASCLIACAGIEDPAEALRAARYALEIAEHPDYCNVSLMLGPCDCGIGKALKLLTPNPSKP